MEDFATVNLADLNTLRIRCLGCKTVFETPLTKIESKLIEGAVCPVCKNSFLLDLGQGQHENILLRLAQTIKGLNLLQKGQAEIEFVIRMEE